MRRHSAVFLEDVALRFFHLQLHTELKEAARLLFVVERVL